MSIHSANVITLPLKLIPYVGGQYVTVRNTALVDTDAPGLVFKKKKINDRLIQELSSLNLCLCMSLGQAHFILQGNFSEMF